MIYLLDRHEQLLDVISDTDLTEFVYQVSLNAFDEATFELPPSLYLEAFKQAHYFGFFHREVFKIFRIVENQASDSRYVKGIDRAESDLRTVTVIKDKRPHNVTADQALTVALEGTGYRVGVVEGLPKVASTSFYYISPLEALVKIIDKWQCEFRVRYVFVENRVTGRYIDLYKSQGKVSGKQFYYGDNLLSVVHEESADHVVTALIGRGKGEELDSGGYGRRIEFTDVVWSKSSGKPTDKPAGQNYVVNDKARQLYGLSQNGTLHHRWGVFIDENIEDAEELLTATYAELERLSAPLTIFKASILSLGEDVWLGDSVAIIRDELKIAFEARVQKLVIDLLNFEQSEVILGDYQTLQHQQQRSEGQRLQQTLDERLSPYAQELQRFYERVETEKERRNAEIDEQFRLARLEFDNFKELAETKANNLKEEITSQINADIRPLADEAKRVADGAVVDLVRQRQELETARNALDNVRSSVATAHSEVVSAKEELLRQAQAQSDTSSRLEQVERTADGTKETVQALTRTVDTVTGDMTGIQRRTKTVEDSLSGLATRFETIRVGGRNLLKNGAFTLGQKHWNFQRASVAEVDSRKVAVISGELQQTKNVEQNITEALKGDATDQVYTYHFWLKATNIAFGRTNALCGVYIDGWYDKNGVNTWFGVDYMGTAISFLNYSNQGWVKVVGKFRVPIERSKITGCYFFLYGRDFTGDVAIAEIMLEKGEIPSDYRDSDEDFRSEFATYKQGVDGQLATLTSNLGDKVSSTVFNQTADEIKQSVSTLNGQVMKSSDFTVDANGLVLQSGREFNGSTITSLLTVNPDNIKAITDKMMITPAQYNLARETFRKYSFVVDQRDFWLTPELSFDLSEGDEYYFEADVTKISSGGGYDLNMMAFITYEGNLWYYPAAMFVSASIPLHQKRRYAGTLKIPYLSRKVVTFRLGFQEETFSNFTHYRVENVRVYKKTSASLIVDGSITANQIASGAIETGHMKAGSVTAAILSADAVTASKLKVDSALIDKLTANDMLARRITASTLFATSVQAVEISATMVKSGILASRNGAMTINLDNGDLSFFNDKPAIRRSVAGLPNQFVKFATKTESNDNSFRVLSNKPKLTTKASVTSIGTNRANGESTTDGAFTGINIFASGKAVGNDVVDRIGIHSDITFISHSVLEGQKGWVFENHNADNNNFALRPMVSRKSSLYSSYIGTSTHTVTKLFVDDIEINGHRLNALLKDLANLVGKYDGWASDFA